MSKGWCSRIGAVVLVVTLLAGCATPGPVGEKATAGAVVGAGTGGLIGAIAGSKQGAVLGVVIGGLLGALVGQSVGVAQSQPPPPVVVPGPPPPPPGQWTVVAPPPPPPPASAPGPVPDPTRGTMTNGTGWEIHVFIDQPVGSPGPLVLRPGTAAPVTLDIGQHRVIAQAFVDTQLGRRLVGTFDRTLTVDPRAPGWTIHFFPASF